MYQEKKSRLEHDIKELKKLRDIVEHKKADPEKLQIKYAALLVAGFAHHFEVHDGTCHFMPVRVYVNMAMVRRLKLSEQEMMQTQLYSINNVISAHAKELRLLIPQPMKTKTLGDLVVTVTAFGFMGAKSSNAEVLFKTAYDNGVRFFDTADLYDDGQNERNLGKAIIATGVPRDSLVISTKGGYRLTDMGCVIDNTKDYILRACEASLRRLKLTYIDLYCIQGLTDDVNLDELMQALKQLHYGGKIRYIGFSQLTDAQVRIVVSKAAEYNLKITAIEREISLCCYDKSFMATCAELGVGVVATSPTTLNFQEGSHQRSKMKGELQEFIHARSSKVISLSELSLAWLSNLAKHIVAIPTAASVEALIENIAVACKFFEADELSWIMETIQGERQALAVAGRVSPKHGMGLFDGSDDQVEDSKQPATVVIDPDPIKIFGFTCSLI